MNKWLVVSILLVAFAKLAFGEEGSISNLSSVEQMQQTFQKDKEKLRIVALLSPT